MLHKKSFFTGGAIGFIIGAVVTFVAFVAIGVAMNKSTAELDTAGPVGIEYLQSPTSYENKTETSFRVFQVVDGAALASEKSEDDYEMYLGTTVMLLGENFYSDQIVTVNNPQRIGTYSYTTQEGMPKTVPVIDATK